MTKYSANLQTKGKYENKVIKTSLAMHTSMTTIVLLAALMVEVFAAVCG